MRRLVFVVVLAILASAVPASAQYVPNTPDGWYYAVQGNQVAMLTADNLGMVRNMTNQLRRSEYRSLRDDLRWDSRYGAYGIPVGGGFYPMYDRNRRPLSRKEATITGAVLGGVAGAGVGYAVGRDARGSLIGAGVGAGVGALIGLVTHRGNNNDRNVVVTPPAEAMPPQIRQQPEGQSVRWGADGIPVAVGTRPSANPASRPAFNPSGSQSVSPTCMQRGMVTLENQSVGPLRVFVKGQAEPFVVLLPKESKCAPTEGEYTGQIVGTVVSSNGLTGKTGTAPAKPQSLPGLILAWR